MQEFVSGEIKINYQYTEYDDNLIGGRSIEIFEFECHNHFSTSRPMHLLLNSAQASFAMIKISPTNFSLKELLFRSGFYYVTTTIDLYEINIQTKKYPNPLSVLTFSAEKKMDVLKDIEHMMLNNFGHGKFFEDFNLKNLAFVRQEEVLSNLAKDNNVVFSLLVNEKGANIGYFIHKSTDEFETLIFAGTRVDALYRGVGDDVWNSFHHFLQQSGIEKTKTLISLSNAGVLNIYAKLGYKFRRPREQYHFLAEEIRNQLLVRNQ